MLSYTHQIIDADGKVDSRIFTGFTSFRGDNAIFSHQLVVLCVIDGEMELWVTDSSELAITNLKMFYMRSWDREPDKIIKLKVVI